MNAEILELLTSFSVESDRVKRREIDARIWATYGVEMAVLVIDMSQFSTMTQRFGIVHFLSTVIRMRQTAQPIIERCGGSVVKFEADNCFAVFPDTASAIRAGIALIQAVKSGNKSVAEDAGISISCGIDYGRFLLVDGKDFYGSAVNFASKLGEDAALPGEILVTAQALALVPETERPRHETRTVEMSGVTITGCSINTD
jgi:class 3 adenylate cyclase